MEKKYFQYGEREIEYLKRKDKKLAEAIEKIGYVYREVEDDLFSSVINCIIGQQISTKAQETIWGRIKDKYNNLTPEVIDKTKLEDLQKIGISFRKAEYIKSFAEKVHKKEFNIDRLKYDSDDEVIKKLSSLKGIGVWTAEMLMIFSMQRQDILSFGDLAIIRGMRMLYHHRKIDKKLFDKYKKRYSPYGSVASLYLWAIAGGAIESMKDYI